MARRRSDLRVNTLKADAGGGALPRWRRKAWRQTPTPLSPLGLRVAGRPPLATPAMLHRPG